MTFEEYSDKNEKSQDASVGLSDDSLEDVAGGCLGVDVNIDNKVNTNCGNTTGNTTTTTDNKKEIDVGGINSSGSVTLSF